MYIYYSYLEIYKSIKTPEVIFPIRTRSEKRLMIWEYVHGLMICHYTNNQALKLFPKRMIEMPFNSCFILSVRITHFEMFMIYDYVFWAGGLYYL